MTTPAERGQVVAAPPFGFAVARTATDALCREAHMLAQLLDVAITVPSLTTATRSELMVAAQLRAQALSQQLAALFTDNAGADAGPAAT